MALGRVNRQVDKPHGTRAGAPAEGAGSQTEHTESAPRPRANLPPEVHAGLEGEKQEGDTNHRSFSWEPAGEGQGPSAEGTGECKPGSGRGQGVTTTRKHRMGLQGAQ